MNGSVCGTIREVERFWFQIEVAVEPLCGAENAADVGRVGRPLRTLRSLRTMLHASPAEIAQSPTLGTVVPYSLVLCALFAHGPPELLSPHVVSCCIFVRRKPS